MKPRASALQLEQERLKKPRCRKELGQFKFKGRAVCLSPAEGEVWRAALEVEWDSVTHGRAAAHSEGTAWATASYSKAVQQAETSDGYFQNMILSDELKID